MILKYTTRLSRSENNPVAKIYDEYTNKALKLSASSFLKFGSHIDCDIFDSTIRNSLKLLSFQFRKFLNSKSGEMTKCNYLDAEAELTYFNTVSIQNRWRIYRAKKKVLALLQLTKPAKTSNNG